MQPFLPWPGSKAKCAAEIVVEFPEKCDAYYEPFLGSGAVFFGLNGKLGHLKMNFKRALLSDINGKLTQCWREVRNDPEFVIAQLAKHLEKNSEDFFRTMRLQMWNAPAFIYVMRAAFNSLYRENLKGEFNVPWRKQDFEKNGRRITYDMSALRACSEYMRKHDVYITASEWHDAVEPAGAGDLVYFDPPYLPYKDTGFVEYSSDGFGLGEHIVLRNRCRELRERGVFVALSNSICDASLRIYGPPTKEISVVNAVNAKATTKGQRPEGLWLYKP